MALKWVDELEHSAPLPVLEPFYVLVALELGDPDGEPRWLEKHAARFHEMYRSYFRAINGGSRHNSHKLPTDSAEVLVQYLVWYPREAAKFTRT